MAQNPIAGRQVENALDATGLRCPLPVLRARKAMKDLKPGSVLEVRATDPAAPKDFRAFCEMAGHEFLEERRDGEVFILRIAKGG